jgi:hypothetical protein
MSLTPFIIYSRIQSKILLVRGLVLLARARLSYSPLRIRNLRWLRERELALQVLHRILLVRDAAMDRQRRVLLERKRQATLAWFGDIHPIDVHLPELSWTTLDRYLIAMDILAPHMTYITAMSEVTNEGIVHALYPTDLVLYKRPTIPRLAAQMLGFYTAFAKTYQHEPQLSIVGHAFRSPGRYYLRFRGREIIIDVTGAKLRSKEWFDIKKPIARSDVLNDAYYQWLYIRELLALNYETLVPRVLTLCSKRELNVLNQVVRAEFNNHPELHVQKVMRTDDKYLYFGLAYARRAFPTLGTTLEIPVFTSRNEYAIADGQRVISVRLPAVVLEPKLQQTWTEKAKYVSVTVDPRDGVEEDVILLPMTPFHAQEHASLSLIETRRPWALITASVRQLPSREPISVAPLGDADRPEWVLPLILLAYIKPYVVSIAGLLLQKGVRDRIDFETAAAALKRALFTRVSLSGVDLPKPPSARMPQLMSVVTAQELFRGFVSDRANAIAEYLFGYQKSLAVLRWCTMTQDFVVSLEFTDRTRILKSVLGNYYVLNEDVEKERDVLFRQVQLQTRTSKEGSLVADEASLDAIDRVTQRIILLSDQPLQQLDSDRRARIDYVQQILEGDLPLVLLRYRSVYTDVLQSQ